jgi:hypothetical protein
VIHGRWQVYARAARAPFRRPSIEVSSSC